MTEGQKTFRNKARRRAVGRSAGHDFDRVAAEVRGRLAERLAAWFLLARGYRILGRRVKTSAGEIDLVVVRAKRLAFVEVKQRATLAQAETAMTARQTDRLYAAAAAWVAARPFYRHHERGFDSVLMVPWCWPSYRRDALQPDVTSRVWVWG